MANVVVVTNVSPSANEKTLQDFFSFCGKIEKMVLQPDPQAEEAGVQSATVTFETASAAETAVLLSNALIVDRPISIVSQSAAEPTSTTQDSGAPETATQDDPAAQQNSSDQQEQNSAVIAKMLANGWELGQKAKDYAHNVDDRHALSLRAQIKAETLKLKANELDAQYKVSEKAYLAKVAAEQKARQLDAQYDISGKSEAALASAKEKGAELAAKALENENIKKGWGMAMSAFSKASMFATKISDETKQIIAEKESQRTADERANWNMQPPPANNPETSTSAPSTSTPTPPQPTQSEESSAV